VRHEQDKLLHLRKLRVEEDLKRIQGLIVHVEDYEYSKPEVQRAKSSVPL
jgi:hypothetical protein